MRRALWLALNRPRTVWRPLVLLGLAYAWTLISLIALALFFLTLTLLSAFNDLLA